MPTHLSATAPSVLSTPRSTLRSALRGPLLQFPLTALLCLLAAETVLPNRALAGSTPVAPPDSGNVVGDTFAPPIPPATGNILTEQAAGNVFSALQKIVNQQSVISVTGKRLFVSPSKAAAIMTAFTADNGDINVNIDVLERQIFEETGGAIEVDLSILGTSTTDIASATESFNTFFTSLTSEQLALAVESPTLMVLWRLLQAAYEATEGEVSTVPGGGLASIVSILLLL